jgi:hypothetical protein
MRYGGGSSSRDTVWRRERRSRGCVELERYDAADRGNLVPVCLRAGTAEAVADGLGS